MNKLINITKTYCSVCGRFVGYTQKDRHTLQAPITTCHICKIKKKIKMAKRLSTCRDLIDKVCAVALGIACIAFGLLVLYHIVIIK